MTLQDPTLTAIYGNIRHFYDLICWRRPGAINRRGDGYVLNYSSKPYLSGANQLWLDQPDCLTGVLVDYVVRFFRPYRAEWSILVIPEIFPGLRARCFRFGGHNLWYNAIMYHPDNASVQPRDTPQIRIEVVSNNIQRYIASLIISETFGMEPEDARQVFRPEHDQDNTIQHYLAFYGGHPAAVATMTFSEDMAGIWNVGTRESFRRKGLARALMVHMMWDAYQRGYNGSMLMASEEGRSVYQKLGYQVIAGGHYMGLSAY